jgi:hypothetical protein
MTSTSLSTNGIATSLHHLYTSIQSHYPSTLGSEQWYLLVLSVFTSTNHCHLSADLYSHLISLPQYATASTRQALMRRLRETLVKLTSIIGVARPLETLVHLSNVTAPEDQDFSFSRRDWKNDASNHERGEGWLKKLYAENLDPIYEMFASHKDFGWISSEITYGLYLSDHNILDGVETEVIVLSGMWSLGLPRMMGWHLRACRRIGTSEEECEGIQQCVSHRSLKIGLAS